MKLKYLFKVKFTDGTTFKQTDQDVSKIDPKRSAFYDVLHSEKPIKSFTLSKLLDYWTVDLETGEFSHNGIKFKLEWNVKPGKKELIFQRQNEQDSVATFNKDTGKILSVEQGAHRIVYFLGYKQDEVEHIVGIK